MVKNDTLAILQNDVRFHEKWAIVSKQTRHLVSQRMMDEHSGPFYPDNCAEPQTATMKYLQAGIKQQAQSLPEVHDMFDQMQCFWKNLPAGVNMKGIHQEDFVLHTCIKPLSH